MPQHSADKHVSQLEHIILIPNQPDFALTPYCVLSGEAANFIIWFDTRPRREPTIYYLRGEHANYYITVFFGFIFFKIHSQVYL